MNPTHLIQPDWITNHEGLAAFSKTLRTTAGHRWLNTSVCRWQHGMTLVEVMISLLIGVFLLAGVLQIFLSTKQTYRMQESLSRLQENGRFAMDFLTKDIRMAGYMGCNSRNLSLTNALNNSTDFIYDFNKSIQGFESNSSTTWAPTLDASFTSPLAGTDAITVRKAEGSGNLVTAHPGGSPPGSADLTVDTTSGLTGDCHIVVVSDCEASAVFQITNINAGSNVVHNTGGGSCTLDASPKPMVPGNATNALGKNYTGGHIFRVNTVSYYIGTYTNNQPSLYRIIGAKPAEELVEGIENMQILYGEDTDNDGTANYYVPANAAGLDMDRVVSVRVSLLVRTLEDAIAAQSLPITYNGATTTPGDRRIRRVFTSTIAVRNRLP